MAKRKLVEDYIGKTINGRLIIGVSRRYGPHKECSFIARCEEGHEVITFIRRLRKHSCGVCKQHGFAKRGNVSPEYQAWCNMKARCYNPNVKQYPRYGGRGIRVCERWRDSFPNFLADMKTKPSAEFSLERTDNDGNYCSENCKWATDSEQASNRSTNHFLEIDGVRATVTEHARAAGINTATMQTRLRKGMSVEEALSKPVVKSRKSSPLTCITVNGVTKPLIEHAEDHGIYPNTARRRIRRGWDPVRAVTAPKGSKKEG